MCVESILGVTHGHFGRHTAYVAMYFPQDLWIWAKFSLSGEVLATPVAITFAKLSILAFFRRLFPVRPMKVATWIIGAFVVAHGLASLLVAFFQCVPFAKILDFTVPGTCIDLMRWSQLMSIPNVISDIALIALPIPQIWSLQMSKPQKAGLTVVFVLAGFNIIASAIRMSIFFTQYLSTDPYMAAIPLHSWSVVEAAAAVVAACLPSFYPFFKRAAQHHRSKRSASPTGGSGSGHSSRAGMASKPVPLVNTKRTSPSVPLRDPSRITAATTITTTMVDASATDDNATVSSGWGRWSVPPQHAPPHEAIAAPGTPVSQPAYRGPRAVRPESVATHGSSEDETVVTEAPGWPMTPRGVGGEYDVDLEKGSAGQEVVSPVEERDRLPLQRN